MHNTLETYSCYLSHNILQSNGIKRLWPDRNVKLLKEHGVSHQNTLLIINNYDCQFSLVKNKPEYEQVFLMKTRFWTTSTYYFESFMHTKFITLQGPMVKF